MAGSGWQSIGGALEHLVRPIAVGSAVDPRFLVDTSPPRYCCHFARVACWQIAFLFGDKSQLMHYNDFLIIVGCFDEDDDGVNILKRSITVFPLLFWDVVGLWR